jgi:hypothetical protein
VEMPDLAAGGQALWTAITDAHELDAPQLVQLTEACRAKDRLDKLDELLRGGADAWCTLRSDLDEATSVLVVNSALDKANTTANLLKQLLAALRLPDDVSGKKPQRRGARGAYSPRIPGNMPASERARLRSVGQ